MCYWIFTKSAKSASKKSVKHMTREGYLNPEVKDKKTIFMRRFMAGYGMIIYAC